jgi:hypothetical protein
VSGHDGGFLSMESCGKALAETLDVVRTHFPTIVEEVKAVLTAAATLLLADQQNPVALNLEGPPSSLKTTIADFFTDPDKVYRSDKFTPKSFVTHATNVKPERLEAIDLLPRIKHRLLIVPELAPLFGLRQEDLLENFSILTRVLDGSGLKTDSGVHGQRGYEGDYLFAWLGCTTPIPHRIWDTMGKLGSRFLFLEMPDEPDDAAGLAREFASTVSYREKVAICRDAIGAFLDHLWEAAGGVRGVEWDRADDPADVMEEIANYAIVLARLRGTTTVWREGSGGEETHNWKTPVIEKPTRAMSLLYALARGHALIHGREQLTTADIPLVARVALESTPNDRRKVTRAVLANNGTVATDDVQRAPGCSAPTARAILETLGVLRLGTYTNPGAHVAATFTLANDLNWLLASKENGRREHDSRSEEVTALHAERHWVETSTMDELRAEYGSARPADETTE